MCIPCYAHDLLQPDAFVACPAMLQGGPLDRPLNAGNLGRYEQARVNANGSVIAGDIIAPWRLILRPNPDHAIPSDTTRDFRQEIHDHSPIGEVVYYVLGTRSPDNDTVEEPIGELVVDSEWLASEWGDKILFFRHSSLQWRAN